MRFLLLAGLLACGGATQVHGPDRDVRAVCCAECSAAAARDPSGYDIRGKLCSSYPQLTDSCRMFADQAKLRVGDCRAADTMR